MKQILIEKYIKPSKTNSRTKGSYIVECWLNEYGDLHSFMGHPAEICYYNERISEQYWYKKGELHRDKNLPAEICYQKYNNKIVTTRKEWYKKGKHYRKNNLPTVVGYNLFNEELYYEHWHDENGYFVNQKNY